MQKVPIGQPAVAVVVLLAASCIAAAYAAPAPVAVVMDGVDGFTMLDGAYAIAIKEISDRTYAFVASQDDLGVQIIRHYA